MAWPPRLVGSGGNRKKWLQQWAGEPTKPGNATLRFCSLPRKWARRTQSSRSFWRLLVDQPADFVGDVIGIGARRLVALVAPGLVGGHGFAADELQRLGAGLVAQGLALQVGGDGEDFQAVLLGQVDALLGVGLGAGVGGAAVEVEFPAGLLPAVEAGVLEKLAPTGPSARCRTGRGPGRSGGTRLCRNGAWRFA